MGERYIQLACKRIDGPSQVPARSLKVHKGAPRVFLHQNQLDVPK